MRACMRASRQARADICGSTGRQSHRPATGRGGGGGGGGEAGAGCRSHSCTQRPGRGPGSRLCPRLTGSAVRLPVTPLRAPPSPRSPRTESSQRPRGLGAAEPGQSAPRQAPPARPGRLRCAGSLVPDLRTSVSCRSVPSSGSRVCLPVPRSSHLCNGHVAPRSSHLCNGRVSPTAQFPWAAVTQRMLGWVRATGTPSLSAPEARHRGKSRPSSL